MIDLPFLIRFQKLNCSLDTYNELVTFITKCGYFLTFLFIFKLLMKRSLPITNCLGLSSLWSGRDQIHKARNALW